MSSEKKWKSCAIRLAKALRTTEYDRCKELNHRAGQYHDWGEKCPVEAENKAALREFEALMGKKLVQRISGK